MFRIAVVSVTGIYRMHCKTDAVAKIFYDMPVFNTAAVFFIHLSIYLLLIPTLSLINNCLNLSMFFINFPAISTALFASGSVTSAKSS